MDESSIVASIRPPNFIRITQGIHLYGAIIFPKVLIFRVYRYTCPPSCKNQSKKWHGIAVQCEISTLGA